MTPYQKLLSVIVQKAMRDEHIATEEVTADNVEDLYGDLEEKELHYDYRSELREGEVETSLPCPWSRHYESKSVAAKASDGSWVGWTYWYGGGKHGEPEAIDWMNEAYDLECKEEEKMVVVREFKKVESCAPSTA